MRPFYLCRTEDVPGGSGTGRVAEGVEFSNGWCAMTWLNELTSVNYYRSIEELDMIHSYGGHTRVVFVDEIHHMQQELEDDDPLLDLIRDIEDHRHSVEMQTEEPPSRAEAAQGIVKRPGTEVMFNITSQSMSSEPQVDYWERCSRAVHQARDDLNDLLLNEHTRDQATHGSLLDLCDHLYVILDNAINSEPTPDYLALLNDLRQQENPEEVMAILRAAYHMGSELVRHEHPDEEDEGDDRNLFIDAMWTALQGVEAIVDDAPTRDLQERVFEVMAWGFLWLHAMEQ